MRKLVSDCAQSEVSNKVLDILRNYTIDDWQSEPYHEHQNPAKRRYQTVIQPTKAVLDMSGRPPKTWLLALLDAIYLLNHVVFEILGWKTPLELLTGLTTDISIILMFSFYEPIYFPTGDALSYAHKPGFFRPIQLNEWGDLSVLANPLVTRSVSKFSLTTLRRSCTGLRFVQR